MTKTEALQAIEKLAKEKQVRKNSNVYATAIAAIYAPGEFIVCGKNTGSGRHAGSISWLAQTTWLFNKAGIAHATTNVAPKGGKAGDRIRVLEITE